MTAPGSGPGGGEPADAAAPTGAPGWIRTLGTGLGCLFLLVGGAVLVVVALAYVFNEPALALAAVALVVALVAYRSRRRT